mmetsp:Transcript_9145/g.25522  ORF Transcript_9145/g.25522 Transcript_9145/m.25522 type:complete len:248 (-) Transcript_9145:1435-2178(-)
MVVSICPRVVLGDRGVHVIAKQLSSEHCVDDVAVTIDGQVCVFWSVYHARVVYVEQEPVLPHCGFRALVAAERPKTSKVTQPFCDSVLDVPHVRKLARNPYRCHQILCTTHTLVVLKTSHSLRGKGAPDFRPCWLVLINQIHVLHPKPNTTHVYDQTYTCETHNCLGGGEEKAAAPESASFDEITCGARKDFCPPPECLTSSGSKRPVGTTCHWNSSNVMVGKRIRAIVSLPSTVFRCSGNGARPNS